MADYAKYNIVTTYVNVFDPKNMAPVSMDFKRSDTGEWAHRDFDGTLVKYQRGKSGYEAKNEAGQLELKESAFDYNGGMYGVLLAALPLTEGFKARFPRSRKTATSWIGSRLWWARKSWWMRDPANR